MKFAHALSAGLLAAALSAGSASAAGLPYDEDVNVVDPIQAVFGTVMMRTVESPLVVVGGDDGGEGGFEEPSVVPLPAAGWLLLAGVAGLAAVRRRKSA